MDHVAPLPQTTPESQGISSTAILAFIDAAEREDAGLHGFMLLRYGSVVASGWWEPFRPTYPHMLYSLSKSFTSTAIGLLVAEGKLSVDDHVLDFFAEEAPEDPSAYLQAMRIRHLLTMTTGHETEPARDASTSWAQTFFTHPLKYEPGTQFLYNSMATYMLSAIVQKLTGQRMIDYLQPRLFAPLGIEDPTWEQSPQGIDTGGWGLSIKTSDIARFGQLYLQKGIWQGVQLIPETWVEEATRRHVATTQGAEDWTQGYGYQFWRCQHNAYRGDGMLGQFCIVMPAQQAVLAINAGAENMQQVIELVWAHLLPAMGSKALPDDPDAHDALVQRTAALQLPIAAGQNTSPLAAQLTGKTFVLNPNEDTIESIVFDFADSGAVFTVQDSSGTHRISCGQGNFEYTASSRDLLDRWNVAASGAWRDDHTYVIQLWRYETPYGRTLTCSFEDQGVSIQQDMNVSFGEVSNETLVGRLR